MPSCCVANCTNNYGNGFVLKRFPRDPIRRKLWVEKVNRNNWTPTDSTRICEAHFTRESFEQNRADGLKRLKYGAVPTIFGNAPPKKSRMPRNGRHLSRKVSNYKTTPASQQMHKITREVQEYKDPVDETVLLVEAPESHHHGSVLEIKEEVEEPESPPHGLVSEIKQEVDFTSQTSHSQSSNEEDEADEYNQEFIFLGEALTDSSYDEFHGLSCTESDLATKGTHFLMTDMVEVDFRNYSQQKQQIVCKKHSASTQTEISIQTIDKESEMSRTIREQRRKIKTLLEGQNRMKKTIESMKKIIDNLNKDLNQENDLRS